MSRPKWTPANRLHFLQNLVRSGAVGIAAERCGLSRQSAYRLRRKDPVFSAYWDAALGIWQEAREREARAALHAWLEGRFPSQDTVNSINPV